MSCKQLPLVLLFTVLSMPFNQIAAWAATDMPEALKPWTQWVLHGHEQEQCSAAFDNSSHFCRWSGPLAMNLSEQGGTFEQTWTMETGGWIFMPGSDRHPPFEITLNGDPATAVSRQGHPAIHVKKAGTFNIKGRFRWHGLPESIQLPEDNSITGPVVINGTLHNSPYISKGRLWLRHPSSTSPKRELDRVDIQVFRKITDSVPMFIETIIDLQVSGRAREVTLGWQTPSSQTPFRLDSTLPVKLDDNRRITVKVKPGRWRITYTTRINRAVKELKIQSETVVGIWPDHEYWVFEARPSLRVVSLSGLSAIDPSMTNIPGDWKSLPAYLAKPGEKLLFTEKKRGDSPPRPDQLEIRRTLWLDEDGKYFTILDHLSGTISESWRLEAIPPMQPGRITINGIDRLITTITPASPPGVEVRHGALDMDATSRLRNSGTIKASGWSHGLNRADATLNLPPGWMLFHAHGVDRASTWISAWSLFDIFIVLIFFLAVARLYGWLKAIIALAAMVLVYHEPASPVMIWFPLLAATALVRVAPEHRFTSIINTMRYIFAALLVLQIIPFSIHQIRCAIYPQLEMGAYRMMSDSMDGNYMPDETTNAVDAVDKDMAIKRKMPAQDMLPAMARKMSRRSPLPLKSSLYEKQEYYHPDIQAMVQTGPGLPSWHWKKIRLYWNGPLDITQEMKLYLVSPAENMALKVAGVILLCLTAFFLISNLKIMGKITNQSARTLTFLILATCTLFSCTSARATDFPPDKLLEELRARLLEPAPCFPECASIEDMRADIKGDGTFTIKILAGALTNTAIPLPRSRELHITDIKTDNRPALLVKHGKDIYTRLAEGRHQIVISGKSDRQAIKIFLPLKPLHVTVMAEEWDVSGVDKNGVSGQQIQLTRSVSAEQDASISVPETLPPFFRVKRRIQLGIKWHVTTTVERISRGNTPVIMQIPLLDGESVTTDKILVKNGMATCSMRPAQRRFQWNSILKQRDKILLEAPDTDMWTEEWELDADMIWHVNLNGIPAIYHETGNRKRWNPAWQPWPGERVEIDVSRPKAISGVTRTIDSTILKIKPGLRVTDSSLDITVRSSKGVNMPVRLPDKAELQSVTIDGRNHSVKQTGREVTIPLHPGSQNIKISWRESRGITRWFVSSAIDLGMKSVNNTVEISPGSRWIWFLTGPRVGPAILFYSELAVLLAAALLLGLSGITPVRTWQWMLLAAGLSQSGLVACGIVAAWLMALGLREKYGHKPGNTMFNIMQTGLIILTIAALGALAFAIQNGLLGQPDMKIAGNGSTPHLLRWYSDRVDAMLPQPAMFSFSILTYRIVMLLWALWLAWNMLDWLKWGWNSFSNGKIWAEFRRRYIKKQNDALHPDTNPDTNGEQT